MSTLLSAPQNLLGFTYLTRYNLRNSFVSTDGKEYQGEPILDKNYTWPSSITDLEARVITGDIFNSCQITDTILPVKKLLSPLSKSQVPIIRCVGLNYRKHAKETKQALPNFPVLFIKPSNSLQDPFEPIKVPNIALNQVDYEAELAVVIKKPCKDVTKEQALDYVLGYTAANDVSARKWQGTSLSSGQWCFSKGFDTFSPIGPVLVSPEIIPNPNTLAIRAVVNGKVLQDSNTSDMIFDIPSLISFLSQGTTLQPGSLILTGTPEGVGFVRSPPIYLQDGDKVSIEIESIGALSNTVEYQNPIVDTSSSSSRLMNANSTPIEPYLFSKLPSCNIEKNATILVIGVDGVGKRVLAQHLVNSQQQKIIQDEEINQLTKYEASNEKDIKLSVRTVESLPLPSSSYDRPRIDYVIFMISMTQGIAAFHQLKESMLRLHEEYFLERCCVIVTEGKITQYTFDRSELEEFFKENYPNIPIFYTILTDQNETQILIQQLKRSITLTCGYLDTNKKFTPTLLGLPVTYGASSPTLEEIR
ncbi:13595_t:CDS:10 [Ambispora gerdemannii]|uniref:13595_t:CDS:1 n=1 Tax=Ambispora gerdemannii TaxID=144530 RepID=A0A9N8V7T6_9GLOM|nr:13595_t:CDS:10 [Ambispora gerdemannii]